MAASANNNANYISQVLTPKNVIQAGMLFFGHTFSCLQHLAQGAYVDLAQRVYFNVFTSPFFESRALPQLKPLGDKIRAKYENQLYGALGLAPPQSQTQGWGNLLNLFSGASAAAAPTDSLQTWTIQIITEFMGLNSEDLLSDKNLYRSVISAAALAGALFTLSPITGVGILPLFWSYQRMRFMRNTLNFAWDVVKFPQNHPILSGAMTTLYQFAVQAMQVDQQRIAREGGPGHPAY